MNRLDRFARTLRPLSRHAITFSSYCQRRCAVARAIPNCQQIAFEIAANSSNSSFGPTTSI
jgi:hypothetical protein